MSKRSGLLAAVAIGAALSAGIAAAQTVVVEPVPAPTPAGIPDPVQSAGSFDRLSTGNQKIARSLFEAQTVDPDGTAPLNLDQIATLKTGAPATAVAPGTTGTGWGNAFKQMQSQGLIDARNLGQVVSGHYTAPTAATTATAAASSSGVVVTNGSGRSFVAGGKTNGKAGVTTAAGSDGGKMTGVSNGKGSAKGPPTVATAGSSAGAGAGAAGGGAKGGGGKANGHSK